jgi:DNA-binding response OmpR family regulator
MVQPEILVADDDASVRDALVSALQLEGCVVSTCSSGRSLMARIAMGRQPTVIVLDIALGDMSGSQCVRAIRASQWADVPVLIFSGWGRIERFGLDVDGIVTKRGEPDMIVGQIRHMVRLGRPRLQRRALEARSQNASSVRP